MQLLYILLTEFIFNILNIKVDVIWKCATIHPIITSNHVSELDPIILLYVLKNDKIRFVADAEVKKMPIFNIICEKFDVVFIERNKERAFDMMDKSLNLDDTVCIFPEGTLFFKSSLERSDNYCNKIGVPKYKNVLAPRESGFNKIQNLLNQHDKYTDITLIYDVDMQESREPLTILEIFRIKPRTVTVIIDETNSSIIDTYRKKDDIIGSYRRIATPSLFTKYIVDLLCTFIHA
jgi:1-acyl-sn-glycerol-3-phosphate acyltransferase